jgi:hypothetical protein
MGFNITATGCITSWLLPQWEACDYDHKIR